MIWEHVKLGQLFIVMNDITNQAFEDVPVYVKVDTDCCSRIGYGGRIYYTELGSVPVTTFCTIKL